MEALKNLEQVTVQFESGILVATVNRPEALNALNDNVLKSLDEVVSWIEKKNQTGYHVRAMILTGVGEKAFVAGADIKQFEAMDAKQAAALATSGQSLFSRIEALPFPVVAAVNGFALGGGLELALACDFIYASENAKFSLPECTLGLMPGFGGTVRLPRRVGPARAREMAMTGAMISSSEAYAFGLVNKVVAQADLMSACHEICKTMALRAPLALAAIKRSIREGMNTAEDRANSLEAELFGQLFSTQDKAEGVKAFIEKRKPTFHGH